MVTNDLFLSLLSPDSLVVRRKRGAEADRKNSYTLWYYHICIVDTVLIVLNYAVIVKPHCYVFVYLQVTSPSFPVVVKMGHAHAGMGKVSLLYDLNNAVY